MSNQKSLAFKPDIQNNMYTYHYTDRYNVPEDIHFMFP